VGVYAIGPYSHLFTGTIDNTFIAYGMAWAACLTDDMGACNASECATQPARVWGHVTGVISTSQSSVDHVHTILLYVLIALCLTVVLLLISIIIILCKKSKSTTVNSQSLE
jgi:hypothetical protein